MALEFEWDPQKAVTNLAKHDFSFEEAATVFGDPLGRIIADPRHSSVEERLVLLRLSEDQRLLAVMYVERPARFGSSVRERPHAGSEGIMKKAIGKRKTTSKPGLDEILPEYDFSRASRNKYASRFTTGSAVVVLEPDVAAAFRNSREANEALRALAGIIEKHRSRRPASRRAL